MTRPVFTSLEEVKDALDVPFGPSEWLVVDQARIDAFADVTGDHQWIHVDAERAATGAFGHTVAHGYLTLSLIPHFSRRLFHLNVGEARVNYGVNKVRFPASVPVGARLRAQATFIELRQRTTGATLTTRYVIEADLQPKPVCVAETVTLVLQN